ncbi:ER degradation-enhancing alpha-mannosidase-like protein 3 [Sarcoptes scabiei]|uniref:alpha-1,2-Mannosidase n=2 Tax=Sarcoptes scabiei TaxID=52283 RepID=A0A834R1M1_SARSC|nr:ER degradation-enhancing alpha-mannosidase-like protein 3 [Sarcoptes scabiei]
MIGEFVLENLKLNTMFNRFNVILFDSRILSSLSSSSSPSKLSVLIFFVFISPSFCFSESERISLKNEAREMFIHAYDSYMRHGYPADELMPLSCKGRYRNIEMSRGDVDDALGNFSLTLIDSLDTLVILGNFSEFEKALRLVINEVSFDSDIVVSVFETNIRVLGGLLSAHVLAQRIKSERNIMLWYNDQLLRMADDIGSRLLAAFSTKTGIPHPRVNLKYGMNSSKIQSLQETCTSCAGTMILEFAALSRLTNNPVYEIKARKAMDYLWNQRHRQSDLVGNIINIDTGDWIRKESGVGAGIDSYYEYCLKAYILLGDEIYLDRFNRHYAGIMKYVSYGPFLIDVHMHRPHNQAKNFMDSLLAFWPGLQVLKGDLKPAIETHEILYKITQKHNFLPEAFTTDLKIHWPHHPLRPEFIESTYFLYLATKDEHYLEVGRDTLRSLQNFTKVSCGYAAVNDVRTKNKEDRMDSFFLSETLKYLYLLFSRPNELGNLFYIFTTEAHLLPLSLSYTNNSYENPIRFNQATKFFRSKLDYHCPAESNLYKMNKTSRGIEKKNYFQLLRNKVNDFVSNRSCPKGSKPIKFLRIRASQFSASKPEHIDLVKQLGIHVIALKDGRVQLVHNSASAQSIEAAEEGAFFMQEMMSLSQQQKLSLELRTVSFEMPKSSIKISLLAGPAQFGSKFDSDHDSIEGNVIKINPYEGCKLEEITTDVQDRIAIIQRGGCMFIEKARNAQALGAKGVIFVDNVANSSSKNLPMFSMSGDGSDDIRIHSVFVYSEDAKILLNALEEDPEMSVKIQLHYEDETYSNDSVDLHSLEANQFNVANITSTQSNYNLKDLSSIFNLFQSEQFKFNLLSVFNLIKSDEENESVFISMLKNFTAFKDTERKFETESVQSERAKNICPNPYRSVSDLYNIYWTTHH